MKTIKKSFARTQKSIVFSLVCIVCLSAAECDTSLIDAMVGISGGIAQAFLSSTNENLQLAGLGIGITAIAADSVRSNSVDYHPNMVASYANLGYSASSIILSRNNTTSPQTESPIVYVPTTEPQTESPVAYAPTTEPQTESPVAYAPITEPQSLYLQANNGQIVTAMGGKILYQLETNVLSRSRQEGTGNSLTYTQNGRRLTTRDSGNVQTNPSQEPNNRQISNLTSKTQAGTATNPNASIPLPIQKEATITVSKNSTGNVLASILTPRPRVEQRSTVVIEAEASIRTNNILTETQKENKNRTVARSEYNPNLSGAHWYNQFPSSQSISDLHSPFRENAQDFVNALEEAGATVFIDTTLRPLNRALLMRYSWQIVRGQLDPQNVPVIPNVDIIWAHKDANDSYSQESSVQAARDMVIAYNIQNLDVAPSITSNHFSGLAIDMNIKWLNWGDKPIYVKNNLNELVEVKRPRGDNTFIADLNPTVIEIGKTYGVIKYHTPEKDRPHWSYNGR
jgi:hypothetical protein